MYILLTNIIAGGVGPLIQVIQLGEENSDIICNGRNYWLSCSGLSLDNNHEDLESCSRVVQTLATIIPWWANVPLFMYQSFSRKSPMAMEVRQRMPEAMVDREA